MERRIVAGPEQNGIPPDGLGTFVVLAWGTTWLLGLPLAVSWLRGSPGDTYMFALAGLSAFGPTLAACVVAGRKRRLRDVLGRFRAGPLWVVLALLTPLLLHLVARLLVAALGGHVTQWFWLPETSAQDRIPADDGWLRACTLLVLAVAAALAARSFSREQGRNSAEAAAVAS